MRFSLPLALICLLGALLRALRFPLRWNQITFAYGAYQAPFEEALFQGRYIDAMGTFFGLHPPLYSLLFAGTHTLFGSMGAVMALSLALSTLTIAATGWMGRLAFGGRVGIIAALMMALSLYHINYSLEINNYPLLICLLTLSHLSFIHYLKGGRRDSWILWQSLAHWAHLLGGLIGGVQALAALAIASLRRGSIKGLMWISLFTLPILPIILGFLGSEGSYQNEPVGLGELISTLTFTMLDRFGNPAGCTLLGIAVSLGMLRGSQRQPGLRITRYLSLGLLLPGLGILILTALGLSASHQHPYYLILLPPLFVLAARGIMALPPLAAGLALILLLIPGLGRSLLESQAGFQAWATAKAAPHGLPGALDAIEARRAPSALWLIAPALRPDDDKVAPDGAYAFIDPRWPCAFYRPTGLGFESTNFEQGQPYACHLAEGAPLKSGALGPGDVAFYTFTAIYPGTMPPLIESHLLRGEPLEIVLYDVESSPDYEGGLRRVLSIAQEARGAELIERRVGATLWFTLTPGAGEGHP